MKLLFIITLLLAGGSQAQRANDNILEELDYELKNCQSYIAAKGNTLDSLRSILNDRIFDDSRRFDVLQQLVSNSCDYDYYTADEYSEQMMELAKRLGDREKINSAILLKANLLFSGGLFMSSVELLDTIDEKSLNQQQLIDYYYCYARNYYGFSEFIGYGSHSRLYTSYGNEYQSKFLDALNKAGKDSRVAKAHLLIHQYKDYTGAAMILKPLCEEADINDRNFAKYATTMAMLYRRDGDFANQEKMLAAAAICDIRNAVRENSALMLLSKKLYNDGDKDRAYSYARKAFDDANSYNARHRKIVMSDIMHLIEAERLANEVKNKRQLSVLLAIAAVLAVIALILLFAVLSQLRKTRRQRRILTVVNKKIQALNADLTEANSIKDTYLIDFFVLCTDYISKINSLVTSSRKLLKSKSYDKLLETLDPMLPHKEHKELTRSFDALFFSLFPTFVDEVNKLLTEEGQITLKNKEALNNELRVYAMMRLGIRDSANIAKFLDCTVNTVYTYRTNIKGRAINKETFEDDLMAIDIKSNNNYSDNL